MMERIIYILLICLNIACNNPTEPPSTPLVKIEKKDTTASEVETSEAETTEPETYSTTKAAEYKLPYNMKEADDEYKLSGKLTEISGLSFNEDESRLLAVNDEQGKIFFLDKKDGDIKRDEKFAKSGDYEGIEQVGDKIYVVNSSGSVYKVDDLDKDDFDTDKFNTKLNSDNDVEGLGYDRKNNRLLIACKSKPGKGFEYRGKRAVYTFDLDKEELSEEPLYLIDIEEIREAGDKKGWLLEEITSTFSPSAIAVHPKSQDVYLLSSVGKLLIVLSKSGKLKHVEQLDKSEYRQPEGLCFAKDGTMYMSSEGKGGKGRIYRFEML
jgi:uncharacterized protein YjiK